MSKESLLHRSRVDIIENILRVADPGAKKTRIMYRCNLSHTQLRAYLKLLFGMKLLESISEEEGTEPDVLKTTAKGLKFLDAYRKLRVLMTQ